MTIMSAEEIIPKYFRDLTYAPRKKGVVVLSLSTNLVRILFFSESTFGEGAGICEQFLTLGVVSMVEAGYGPSGRPCQILSETPQHELHSLSSKCERFLFFSECAYSEGRKEDGDLYLAKSLEAEIEAAEKFNAVIRISEHTKSKRGFTLFSEEE